MSFGVIELTTVSRAQEYSAIKQNEDNKGLEQQGHISVQIQKDTLQKARDVQHSDNARWNEQNQDAGKKGKGQYSGERRQRQEKEHGDRVIIKGKSGFDIKI